MIKSKAITWAGGLAIALLGAAAPASADTIGFGNISANDVGDANTGESQLQVEVTDSAGKASFKFTNSGPEACSITDVYFDDDAGVLASFSSIINGTGVDFSVGASPGDLPSGNSADPDFSASIGFTADSNPPAQPNGVNPGEQLTILMNLIAGKTTTDVLNALTAGTLRIGIHVQGFDGGGSESFVTTPPNGHVIPVPAAVWGGMALFGALGAGKLIRHRRDTAEI